MGPMVPEAFALEVALQPPVEWSAIWLDVIPLTPSTMSISPPSGHCAAFVQKPGQTWGPTCVSYCIGFERRATHGAPVRQVCSVEEDDAPEREIVLGRDPDLHLRQ